jgi:hypothetical protein
MPGHEEELGAARAALEAAEEAVRWPPRTIMHVHVRGERLASTRRQHIHHSMHTVGKELEGAERASRAAAPTRSAAGFFFSSVRGADRAHCTEAAPRPRVAARVAVE